MFFDTLSSAKHYTNELLENASFPDPLVTGELRETKRFGHMSKGSRPSALVIRNPESANCHKTVVFINQTVRNIIQRNFANRV